MSDLPNLLSSLVASGANWNPPKKIKVGDRERVIRTLSHVRYNQDAFDEGEEVDSHYNQSLDITFPDGLIVTHPTTTTSSSTTEEVEATVDVEDKSVPVFVFVHGGGWSRGGKDNWFYGAPSVCENMAASGCISVAPGYRLGNYPEFLHDVACAIRWVKEHLSKFGGDLNQMYLGGHSAGGHIASLLLLRHKDFLLPQDISPTFFKGLILLSGVYDLFCPLKKELLDAKNKAFVLAYVLPAFGSDEAVRRNASPLLLLHPEKDTSILGKAAMSLMKMYDHCVMSDPDANKHEFSIFDQQPDVKEKKQGDSQGINKYDTVSENNTDNMVEVEVNTESLPRSLIMNASIDMGLQENGELMAAAMAKHTQVEYQLVLGADHASICWNQNAFMAMRKFMGLQLKEDDE